MIKQVHPKKYKNSRSQRQKTINTILIIQIFDQELLTSLARKEVIVLKIKDDDDIMNIHNQQIAKHFEIIPTWSDTTTAWEADGCQITSARGTS